jgi:hypothetical protein
MFERCEVVTAEGPEVRPALKNGAELQWWTCRVTGLNPKVAMELHGAYDISVENGPGFGHVLDEIRGEVTEILNAPEIIAAVS